MSSLPVAGIAWPSGLTAGAAAPALAAEELATGTATYDVYLDPSKPSLFAGLSGRVVTSVTLDLQHLSYQPRHDRRRGRLQGCAGHARDEGGTVEDGDTL